MCASKNYQSIAGSHLSLWPCLKTLLLRHIVETSRAVREAQSTSTSARLTPWQKYCLLPPKELLRLRSLVARGRARKKVRTRAKTPREIELLFTPSFPNELFWKVMAFWNPRH